MQAIVTFMCPIRKPSGSTAALIGPVLHKAPPHRTASVAQSRSEAGEVLDRLG